MALCVHGTLKSRLSSLFSGTLSSDIIKGWRVSNNNMLYLWDGAEMHEKWESFYPEIQKSSFTNGILHESTAIAEPAVIMALQSAATHAIVNCNFELGVVIFNVPDELLTVDSSSSGMRSSAAYQLPRHLLRKDMLEVAYHGIFPSKHIHSFLTKLLVNPLFDDSSLSSFKLAMLNNKIRSCPQEYAPFAETAAMELAPYLFEDCSK